MYCSSCGSSNKDGSAYCVVCGASLKMTDKGHPAPQSPTFGVADGSTSVSSGYQQAAPVKGVVSSAWSDLRKSQGWIKKVFLLALIKFIPILNWVAPGYAMKWGRGLVHGESGELPKKIFADGSFTYGAYNVLISILVSLVLGVVGFVLGKIQNLFEDSLTAFLLISLVTFIVILLLSVFMKMFSNLCVMKGVVARRCGACFELSKVWNAFRRKKLGALFCAVYIPKILTGLVFGVCLIILFGLFYLIFSEYAYGFMYFLRYGNLNGVLYNLAQTGLGFFFFFLVGKYLSSCCESISELVSYRALSHWINRFAPEWKDDMSRQQNMPKQQRENAYYSSQMQPVGADTGTTLLGGDDMGTTLLVGDDMGTTCLERGIVLRRQNGEEIAIKSFPAVIGKGTAADVRIDGNSSISRTHARIIKHNDDIVIEDLNSTNKTSVDGTVLTPGEVVRLHEGAELKLGSEVLKVVITFN